MKESPLTKWSAGFLLPNFFYIFDISTVSKATARLVTVVAGD